MLEIQPFVKIAWNNSATRKEFAGLLEKIHKVSYDAEYEMVKRGLRKANVYHMTPRNFDKDIEKITRDGLVYLPMVRSKMYNGFSHRHYPVNELDFNCFVYGVVAKDLETAQKFVDASNKGDNIAQGELLGYPKCCCEAFQKNWTTQKVLDPCYEAALNAKHSKQIQNAVYLNGNGITNVMLRYFGVKVIPFFPCSYDCEEALEVAKVWQSVMETMDADATKTAVDMLNQPLTWNMYKQIIYITTPLYKGVVNGYECVRPKTVVWNEDSSLTNQMLNAIEQEVTIR